MDSIVSKRLVITSTLIIGFIAACGSDDPPGGSPSEVPDKTLVCTSDEECAEDEPFCDPYSGCAECLFNAQCPEGSQCVENECVVPTTCASSADCDTEDPVCNTILDQCVGCVGDFDCAEDSVCLTGRCTEVTRCVNTLDCAEGEVCERSLGYCVQCVGDADCGEESACIENACVLRCDSDNDCRSGNLLCDAAAGHCVECVEHADCPEVYNCRSGRCVVDECLQGTSSCNESFGIDTCNEIGSGTEFRDCSFTSTCVDDPDSLTAACITWVCEPNTSSCSDDGNQLLVCTGDGLSYATATDCAAEGGTCEDGACADVVCTEGSIFCDAGVLYQCAASGTSFTALQACGTLEYCNEEAGTCSIQTCTPGAKVCAGTIQQECNSEGSAVEDSTDCAEDGDVCLNGECVPTICTPGEKRCNEDLTAVYVCDSLGTAMNLSNTCLTGYYCDEVDPYCRVRECVPGAALCEGEVATTCNDVGSGVEEDGTDCSEADDQACWGGSCLPRICTASRHCKDGDSYTCSQNGTAEALADVCSSSEFCNDETGYCQSQACTPAAVGCLANTPAVCNAEGSAYEANGDPCDVDEACVSGTCLPLICTANAYYCEGQVIYRCGTDGTTTSLVSTCSESRYCEEGVSTCQLDVCTAAEPVCDGALLSVCKSDGSGPEPDGDECPSGQTCDNDACADVICEPGVRFCENDAVVLCNSFGTGAADTDACSTAQFCDESLDPVACSLDICEAGQPACDGERLATCAANGGGYTDRSTNCANSDKVCSGTACVNNAKDIVGEAAYTGSYSSYRLANRYYITTDRTLTEIEQYMSVSGTSQFTWFVYEGTTSSSFTKVFETLNTSSGSAVFHSSGTISVPLVKGRYYMIGVRVSGSATAYYGDTSTNFVSFGSVSGLDSESTSGTLPSSWSVSTSSLYYHQTLTTTLP